MLETHVHVPFTRVAHVAQRMHRDGSERARAFPTEALADCFRQTCPLSHSVTGPEAAGEDTGPVTIYDIQEAED